MSGAAVSCRIRAASIGMEILMTIGSRGCLPNPAVAGYYEGEAQGRGDRAQLIEEKE